MIAPQKAKPQNKYIFYTHKEGAKWLVIESIKYYFSLKNSFIHLEFYCNFFNEQLKDVFELKIHSNPIPNTVKCN